MYNNVKIQFSLSKNAPSTSSTFYYRVTMRLQNLGVLDGSITHNFPYLTNKVVACKSVTDSASNIYNIVCDYVGSLQSGKTYYLAAKIWFSSSHTFATTNNLGFGKITIEAVTVTDVTSNTLSVSSSLFTSNGGETLSSSNFLLASNLRGEDAYAGYKYSFYDAQVISVPESGLSSSTSDSITYLWSLIEN